MSTQTRAIYHDGKLYLDDALPFPNGTPVIVTVEDAETASNPIRGKVHSVLVKAGLVKPGPVPRPTTPTISSERAAELSDLFAESGSMSDIIHNERDECEMS